MRQAARAGIAYLPEDRKTQGLVLCRPVVENVTMAIVPRIAPRGWVIRRTERRIGLDTCSALDIRTPSLAAVVENLSGGNQQKVVIGKWLAADPSIFLLDEPTRGVDVGAKRQIHQLIETKGYARAVDIAAGLGISQASVSGMIQRLDAEGFVVYEKYRGVVLTDRGREIARQIVQRHEVLTRLLRRFGIDEETIYRDVEGMEHHISVKTLDVLTLLTEELERNPDLARRLKRRMESGRR